MRSCSRRVPWFALCWLACSGCIAAGTRLGTSDRPAGAQPSAAVEAAAQAAGAGVGSHCGALEGVTIVPLSRVATTLEQQSLAAACTNRKRRDEVAKFASDKVLELDYVFVGGGFAAQNVLANAPMAVRANSVVLSSGSSGIIAGSENPAQAWDVIFTGHGPPAGDTKLRARWATPAAFKELFPGTPANNATNLALQYTRALNEYALGVPVVPCRASALKLDRAGRQQLDCRMEPDVREVDGRIVTIKARRGVIITAGLGLPKDLAPTQISARDQQDLRASSVSGLPRLFSEWTLFQALKKTPKSARPDLHGKSLFIIGGGNAAASSITDILDPSITPLEHRPAHIYLLAREAQVDGPDFAPAVYARARQAARCSLGAPRFACEGDYGELTVLDFGATSTRSVVAVRDGDSVTSVSVTYSIGGDGRTATQVADLVLTAISNTSVLGELLDSSLSDTSFQAITGYNGSPYALDVASGSAVTKLDPHGLPIGIEATNGLPIRLTGAALVTSAWVADAFSPPNADLLRAMLGRYQSALMADYDARNVPGGRSNINQGALLFNGWITAEFGARIVSLYGEPTNTNDLSRFYRP